MPTLLPLCYAINVGTQRNRHCPSMAQLRHLNRPGRRPQRSKHNPTDPQHPHSPNRIREIPARPPIQRTERQGPQTPPHLP